MIVGVSAFGYEIPLAVILVAVALVVGLGLTVMFWLTVVWSIYRSIGATRRERVYDDLQDDLLDRVFDPTAEWEPWVAGLSGVERDVVEELLDEYLRELDGGNADRLRELGVHLGVPERSRTQLRNRSEYDRLYALTWLTLLDRPEALDGSGFTPQTPRERASVARLRYECDDFEEPREGIELLLSGAQTQFSAFGQDTLYRIALADPAALLAVSAASNETWSDALLAQVLAVCRHVGTNVRDEDLSWLFAALDHENERVREAATLALGNVGWRTDVRADPFVDRVLSDESPRVRGAVYRLLARWGDQEALDRLTAALREEKDPRARLTGMDALVDRRETPPPGLSDTAQNTWHWSREHAAYDGRARGRTPGVSD